MVIVLSQRFTICLCPFKNRTNFFPDSGLSLGTEATLGLSRNLWGIMKPFA